MPRPAGLSGWVNTATTENCCASNASSAVAAKSGVPAKMIFREELIIRIPYKLMMAFIQGKTQRSGKQATTQ